MRIQLELVCVACEAWSTPRGHVSVVVSGVVVNPVVTLLLSHHLLLKGCINCIESLQEGNASLIISRPEY